MCPFPLYLLALPGALAADPAVPEGSTPASAAGEASAPGGARSAALPSATLQCPAGWSTSEGRAPSGSAAGVECSLEVLTSCLAVEEPALAATAAGHFAALQQSLASQGVGALSVLEAAEVDGRTPALHRARVLRGSADRPYSQLQFTSVREDRAVVVICSARDATVWEEQLGIFEAFGRSLVWD